MNRILLPTSLAAIFFATTICLLTGCGDGAVSGLRGAMQKVGAKVVEGSSDEAMRNIFEAANKACPTRMDAFTTLEKVEMIDESRVEFHYVINDAGKEIAARFDKRAMKKAAVEQMRGNPMAVAIAQRDLSIEHIYEDSAGNHILSYTLNRAVIDGELDAMGGEQSNPFDVTPVKADDQPSVERDAVQPAVAQPVEQGQQVEEVVEETPSLPQPFSAPKRTKENPAGVQSNPYFSGS